MTVIRDGKKVTISIYKLLVGDVLEINQGDKIPADLVLIKGNQVITDESNVTGEPAHINKTPIDTLDAPEIKTDCFVLGGSAVVNGSGVGIICAVGPNSVQGKA